MVHLQSEEYGVIRLGVLQRERSYSHWRVLSLQYHAYFTGEGAILKLKVKNLRRIRFHTVRCAFAMTLCTLARKCGPILDLENGFVTVKLKVHRSVLVHRIAVKHISPFFLFVIRLPDINAE